MRVVFKLTPDDRTLIAFFHPEDAPANPGNILSYQTIGQHAEASMGYFAECKPCAEARFAPLLNELKMIGYDNLEIRKRFVYRR